MTVAVESGLEQVAALLQSRGYQVVPLHGYHGGIDAVVYRTARMPGQMESANFMTQGVAPSQAYHGILMVNAAGKTPEQVYAVLQTRVYSPLF